MRRAPGWTRVALAAGVCAIGLYCAGANQVVATLARLDPRWVLAACLLTAAQLWLLGWRWSLLSRALGVPLPVRLAVAEYTLSVAFNQILPSGFAGDGLRALRQVKRSTAQAGAGVESVVLDRLSGQLGLVLLAILTLPFSGALAVTVARHWLPLALAIAGSAGAVLVVARFVPRLRAFGGRFGRALVLLLHPGRAAAHWCLSLGLAVLGWLQWGIAALAIDQRLDWTAAIGVGPLFLLAASLPSFFGGWGVREGASAVLFAALGLPASAGLAVSVVYGVFGIASTLPALLWMPWLARAPEERP